MKSFKFFWTIFKIERLKTGKYVIRTSIDPLWLENQRNKIITSDLPVIFIIADQFAKEVYSCELKDKYKYLNKLNKIFTKLSNFEGLFYESDLIKKCLSVSRYEQLYLQYQTGLVKKDIDEEMEKRKTMYNPKNYEIRKQELRNLSIKSLALFKVEEDLIKSYN